MSTEATACPVCRFPNGVCRDDVYHKLMFLARCADHMGDDENRFDADDYYALFLLIAGVAREIFPEWNARKPGKE